MSKIKQLKQEIAKASLLLEILEILESEVNSVKKIINSNIINHIIKLKESSDKDWKKLYIFLLRIVKTLN